MGRMLRGIGRCLPGKAVPLVFLHGFLDNCHSFLGLTACLPEFPAYAVDLPGHGRSSHADAEASHYAPDDFVHQIRCYLERHHGQPVVLVGHSMGAAIASTLAAQSPHLVAALVLLDQFAPLGCSHAAFFERLKSLIWRSGPELRVYPSRAAAIEARVGQGTGRVLVNHLAIRGLEAVAGGCRWSYDSRLLAPVARYRSEDEVVSLLQSLRQPVLFLEASADYAREKARQRAAYLHLLRDVHHVILPGSHHFHAERPQVTAQAIRAFLGALGLEAADPRIECSSLAS